MRAHAFGVWDEATSALDRRFDRGFIGGEACPRDVNLTEPAAELTPVAKFRESSDGRLEGFCYLKNMKTVSTRSRILASVVLSLLPRLCVPAVGLAQGGGTVTGRVVDQTDLPFPGVSAQLQSDMTEDPIETVTDGDGTYRFSGVRVVIEGFNLLNARVSDIEYFFASRLPGEPAGGVEDIHLHAAIPRSLRMAARVSF